MAVNSVLLQPQRINRQRQPGENEDTRRPPGDVWVMLAHDLRNPLMAMQKVFEVAIGDSRNDRTRGLLVDAHANCDLLLDLLTDVLDSYRSQTCEGIAGTGESPSVIVDASLRLVQALANEKGINFRTLVPPDAPRVVCARPIIRVLTNVVHNAVKFSAAGGSIEVEVKAVAGRRVIFSVTNERATVPAEKLLEIHHRDSGDSGGSESRAAEERGYGWGLYYCETTLAALGGEIWVESVAETNGERTAVCFKAPSC